MSPLYDNYQSSSLTVRFIASLHDIDSAQWDELFAPADSGAQPYPFAQHAFLVALEDSGCTSEKAGWEPSHLVVEDEHGQIVAVMVLYRKSHSYGEYVFDWSWSDAYAHSGREYFPKLISAMPFTPATGPRYAISKTVSQERQDEIATYMSCALIDYAADQKDSSVHVLFPAIACLPFGDAKWMPRYGCQFHWFNRNMQGEPLTDFDDFLSTFTSRKRKNIKKERAKVAQQDIVLSMSHARDIPEDQWQTFYNLYHRTYLKRSGRYGYLNYEFFAALPKALPDQVVMCQAHRDDEMIAAALYFRDEETLYGRYWGATEEVDGLHFEACYYQGIEYAIAQGLKRFDPGAQGEHKIQRGFVPIKTTSLHTILDPMFSQAIGDFLIKESDHIDAYIEDGRRYLPFKEEVALPAPNILISPEL